MYREAQAMLIDVSPGTGSNQGLTDELFTTIAEYQAIAFDTMVEFTFLGKFILDLKQISKVRCRLNAYFEVNWFAIVIEDGQILVKAVSYRSFANDRLLSIHIDGAGSRNEEELHFEVFEVIRRQNVRTLPVKRQNPA